MDHVVHCCYTLHLIKYEVHNVHCIRVYNRIVARYPKRYEVVVAICHYVNSLIPLHMRTALK